MTRFFVGNDFLLINFQWPFSRIMALSGKKLWVWNLNTRHNETVFFLRDVIFSVRVTFSNRPWLRRTFTFLSRMYLGCSYETWTSRNPEKLIKKRVLSGSNLLRIHLECGRWRKQLNPWTPDLCKSRYYITSISGGNRRNNWLTLNCMNYRQSVNGD